MNCEFADGILADATIPTNRPADVQAELEGSLLCSVRPRDRRRSAAAVLAVRDGWGSGNGGDSDRAADHGKGERKCEGEFFHEVLRVQHLPQPPSSATAGVSVTAEMATAPPITARLRARAIISFFINVLPFPNSAIGGRSNMKRV